MRSLLPVPCFSLEILAFLVFFQNSEFPKKNFRREARNRKQRAHCRLALTKCEHHLFITIYFCRRLKGKGCTGYWQRTLSASDDSFSRQSADAGLAYIFSSRSNIVILGISFSFSPIGFPHVAFWLTVLQFVARGGAISDGAITRRSYWMAYLILMSSKRYPLCSRARAPSWDAAALSLSFGRCTSRKCCCTSPPLQCSLTSPL